MEKESIFSILESHTPEIGSIDVAVIKEGFNRGKISSNSFFNAEKLKKIIEVFKLRKFVAKHELGHLKIAQRLGWRVHGFNYEGNGSTLGFVQTSPPNKPFLEILRDWVMISAGGELATGSTWGCSSDLAHQTQASNIAEVFLKLGSSFRSTQRARAGILLPFGNALESEAISLAYNAIAKI